jgi:hypothetical protein
MGGGQREQQRQRKRPEPRRQRQHERDQRVEDHRQPGHQTAVEAVGNEARNRGQHELRQELDEPEQAELERGFLDVHAILAAGDIVELVAQHHDHARCRQHRKQAGDPETAEIRDLEGGRQFALGQGGRAGRHERVCGSGPTVCQANNSLTPAEFFT